MTTCETTTPFVRLPADADVICIYAEYVCLSLILRLSVPGYGEDDEWPQGAVVDAASDERWEIEERALASEDAKAPTFAKYRRERNGID